jgi:ribosomal-protein-alanine N-acetyltransferase
MDALGIHPAWHAGPGGDKDRGVRDGFVVRPFLPEEAKAASQWRYDDELAAYSGEPGDVRLFMERPPGGAGYYVIDLGGEMVGFCCFGVEAMVAGQRPPRRRMVDVGISIRPDQLSRGLGTRALPAVLHFATEELGATAFRAAIATFNERSMRLFRRHGFRTGRILPSRGDIRFVEVVKRVSAQRDPAG